MCGGSWVCAGPPHSIPILFCLAVTVFVLFANSALECGRWFPALALVPVPLQGQPTPQWRAPFPPRRPSAPGLARPMGRHAPMRAFPTCHRQLRPTCPALRRALLVSRWPQGFSTQRSLCPGQAPVEGGTFTLSSPPDCWVGDRSLRKGIADTHTEARVRCPLWYRTFVSAPHRCIHWVNPTAPQNPHVLLGNPSTPLNHTRAASWHGAVRTNARNRSSSRLMHTRDI